MNNIILLFALVHFPLTTVKLFVSRRLLRLATPAVKLIIFSCLQGATIALFEATLPLLAPKVILLTLTHIVFHIFVFNASLIPEALFAVVFPIASGFVGELIFVYVFRNLNTTPSLNFSPFFAWMASLPVIALALFFILIRKTSLKKVNLLQKRRLPKNRLQPYLFYTAAVVFHSLCSLNCALHLGGELISPTIYLYAGIIVFPLLGATLLKYIHDSQQAERTIHYHAYQNRLQKSTVRALRKERHDFLNDLTLISSYLQMGRWEDAQECIASTAASLSDRYDYPSLPEDAWLTVLAMKQKEAVLREIDFAIHIEAQPPQDYTAQRLLLKVIINLVDNAFRSVSESPKPQVRLYWSEQPDGSRLLSVVDNGPPIPAEMKRKIFQPGVTSKEGNSANSGWGLAICRQIANELGGTLSFQTSATQTSFDLILPLEEEEAGFLEKSMSI